MHPQRTEEDKEQEEEIYEETQNLNEFSSKKVKSKKGNESTNNIKIMKALVVISSIFLFATIILHLKVYPSSQQTRKQQQLRQSEIEKSLKQIHGQVEDLKTQIHESKKPNNQKSSVQVSKSTAQQLQITDEEIQTKYTKRLVTSFKGYLPEPPILDISNEQQIKNYLETFMGEEFDLLKYSVNLYENPNKSLLLQSEYYRLNQRYSIGKYTTQLPICVIAPGKNIVSNIRYLRLLESLNNQNYTNYRLFITDDASTDGTYNVLKQKIQQFSRLRVRTTLIKNYQNIGALGNKYLMINNHCQKGSIVFDVDADDSLIGRQIMKLMNALYQSSNKWFIYSNFIWPIKGINKKGLSKQLDPQLLAANKYRIAHNDYWGTSALRTYLRDLYIKIPKSYFMESQSKFYLETSDRFQMYALVELAGPKNIKHIPDLLYWYIYTRYSECAWSKMFYFQYISRSQTPMLPLNSLDQEVKITQDYAVPENITERLKIQEKDYKSCKVRGKA